MSNSFFLWKLKCAFNEDFFYLATVKGFLIFVSLKSCTSEEDFFTFQHLEVLFQSWWNVCLRRGLSAWLCLREEVFSFLPLGRGLSVLLCLWEEVFLFLPLGRGFYFSLFAGKRASEEGFSHFASRECITDHGEMCASELGYCLEVWSFFLLVGWIYGSVSTDHSATL